MNLPFAPDGLKKYAPVRLVQGIEDSGHTVDDVQVVFPDPEDEDHWLVTFNNSLDRLRV